ncbi:DNA adenine methylase [Prochlorococcus phage Syn33]|uniref:DNA adenine methylase n=4 Tax=Brizovirus syn33 TaxID=2734097 RepID=E3SQU5_9CAUD|nr:DNA adenine methylase [Prochlorococcus phage Syn33]ADO99725.1 DNA adenine methylase [Prochlorococcus phage Syn33]
MTTMNPFELHQGDCLSLMNDIQDKSIDLICCDPPYGTTNIKWDEVLDFDTMWAQYDRILKPKGVIVLFGSQPFSAQLICSKLDWFRYELVWNKNKCGSPGLAKKRPMKTHENILIFYKEAGGTYNPQMEVGEPYARKSKSDEGYVGKKNDHGYGMKPRKEFENKGTRYPKSILNISRDFSAQQQVHPTQKPVPMLEWLIKTYSNEGDTVLDNCMGSGSTGVAAINLNRKFIGMETNEEYFNISAERIGSVSIDITKLL